YAACGTLALDLLVGADHLERDRRRVLAAGTAVFDQDHYSNLGRARRCVAREPRMLAVEIPNALNLDTARDVVRNLRRASLTCDVDVVEARSIRGAADLVDAGNERFLHEREMLLLDVEVASHARRELLHHGTGRGLDCAHDLRLVERAAV